ncbi:glycoside hydrolase family 79 protein [Flagelloscypha sp. PMI_526]|nr:glycoside hydrolase family 79 protein [Flagelloscypha sp. PMI_526]
MLFSALAFLALARLALTANLEYLKLNGPSSLPADASHHIHPSLASFSIETAFVITFLGNVSQPNELTSKLLRHLHERSSVELRIGGITADSTYWNQSLPVAIDNFIDDKGVLHNTTIGPEFFNSIRTLWPEADVTMNLDLHDLSYEGALEVANGTVVGLGDQLVALEIGNEPDHYSPLWSAEKYAGIWSEWSKNISDALGFTTPMWQVAATAEDPLWPYQNPDGLSSALDCVSAMAAGANAANTVKLCSEHTYQYSVCDPARAAVAILPNLVNHTRLAMYMDLWIPRIRTMREQLGEHGFLIGEYSSVSCSGHDGVSNTFGQALWLLDTSLYAASLNVSRLYSHQGGPLALQSSTQLNHGGLSFYDMWWPVDNTNGQTRVFPSYHTYLFLGETLSKSNSLRISNIYPGRQSNGSTITVEGGDTSQGQLIAYGIWDDKLGSHYPSKLALLNVEIYNQTANYTRPSTTFDISQFLPRQGKVTVKKLQAPGADVMFGNLTTWAGQTFGFTGDPVGKLVKETVRNGQVVLRASEAALVEVVH